MKKTFISIFLALFIICTISAFAESGDQEIGNKIIGTYTVNDQIVVNEVGRPEGKPITSGFLDHKPVWSKTGGKIVFFRVKKYSSSIAEWQDAICVINTDGTGFRELTDGTFHDYNPTWMRDGTNRIIFNRYSNGRTKVYITSPDNNPGEEQLISDPQRSEYAYTSLKDGRIFVTSDRSPSMGIIFLLTPIPGQTGKYEPVKFVRCPLGLSERASISPNEKRITYELNRDYRGFSYNNHPLIIADFNLETLTVSRPIVISKPKWYECDIYPRWTKDESAVIYHSNRSGKWQLYKYDLADGTTVKVSTDSTVDYKYFCGEESPY